MPAIHPYLNFNSKTEEVFNFYKSVFGGDFQMVMRFGDVPEGVPAMGNKNHIMHISLPIGNGYMLMGSDIPEGMEPGKAGTNFSISISADSKDEADRLYNGLSAGGKQTMPMDNAFWGSYFGMLEDKYGINWMVGFDQQGKS